MHALLDPRAVAWHSPLSISAADAIEVIRELWTEMEFEDLTLLTTDALIATLSAADLFPLRESYSAMLAAEAIHHTSGQDLASLVLDILQKSERMEALIEDLDLIECTCMPQLGLGTTCACHPEFDEVAEHSLHLYGAFSIAKPKRAAMFYATSRTAGSTVSSIMKFDSIWIAEEEPLEEERCEIHLTSARSLDASLSWVAPQQVIVDHGLTPDAVRFAIEAAARQAHPDRSMPTWLLGAEFCDQLRGMGVLVDEGLRRRALRACVEILLGTARESAHHLRAGGPGSGQLKRKGAAAWRQDVDREVHIHFWVHPDGSFQLASFAGHNYFDIPGP